MASQIVHFAGLSDRDHKTASPLPKLAPGDKLEIHIHHEGGREQRLSIPPSAAAAVEALLAHVLRGERVAVLAEDQELSARPKRRPFSASRVRSSCCAWTGVICHSAMSANAAAPC
ncbi:hypothetical protein [Sinorhizobium mexicanum]|uniref:hypothetical protein n=1 Tax=Sinorhizobium mexicanum TaxID=375549 RepID=UPI001E024FE8|nr:hypothetical protein [Sinorhizobium mexicanum]MBP1884975.1 hypothetical protein [Sinorhizobium mexicanum]